MKRMTAYDWEVYNWFTQKVTNIDQLKEMAKKHFNTENVDILTANNIVEIYEKEKKLKS